jgi:inorganic pyrophosphatase
VTGTISDLAPFSDAGALHAVVESPRGSRVKFEYDPEHSLFVIHRPLPSGLAYPYDFGFVPGTRAGDGDPIDVLILGDHVAYPGTLMHTHVIAALQVVEVETAEPKKQVTNPRIIAVPVWLDFAAWQAQFERVKDDLAQFMVKVGESAGKTVREAQWQSASVAREYVESHTR